ncbi:class I SAM-dependent methyltransferase [Geomonas oryzae]|uniref:class I SAM-dependent methyltransferase n=1 Tax=Geomonas oryzae TaxID=2364273 RepID=UPI00100A998F|nr:methyltransferase domain-containing protein [Geomonas oryzae]
MDPGKEAALTERGPWEVARARTVAMLLGENLRDGMSVLDVDCGDGYLSRSLCAALPGIRVTAVVADLTERTVTRLVPARGVIYVPDLPAAGRRFELTLLVDVLERVEEDRRFLKRLVWQHVAAGGHVLITVPAFPSLFSGRDWFLGRYRRYRLKELREVAAASGLAVLSSGYLFGSLLIPKFLMDRCTKWQGAQDQGPFRLGGLVSRGVAGILHLENAMMIVLARAGLVLPGVSAWVLCRSRVPSN